MPPRRELHVIHAVIETGLADKNILDLVEGYHQSFFGTAETDIDTPWYL